MLVRIKLSSVHISTSYIESELFFILDGFPLSSVQSYKYANHYAIRQVHSLVSAKITSLFGVKVSRNIIVMLILSVFHLTHTCILSRVL